MKKLFTFSAVFFIFSFTGWAQQNSVQLEFNTTDADNSFNFVPDSILVKNLDRNCDSMIRDTNILVLEWFEGIGELPVKNDSPVTVAGENPFRGKTSVEVQVNKRASVTLRLLDALGKPVTHMEKELTEGSHLFTVSVANPGNYFLFVQENGTVGSVKLVSTGTSDGSNIIRYGGNARGEQSMKSTAAGGQFFFIPGDNMEFTVYKYGYETETFTDAPEADKTYDLQMTPNLFDFYADTTRGYAPLNVQFYGVSNMKVKSWHWDFGDGTTSDMQNPSHIYMEQDKYFTVELVMVDSSNITHRITKEGYIHLLHDAASVNFTSDYTEGFSPQTIHFFGYINFDDDTYWLWTFGDGETAENVENPYHEYISAGVYTVKLTVYSTNGVASETKEDYIRIGVCPNSVDYEGETYETVRIANQCWMKKNLNVGEMIDVDEGPDYYNNTTDKWCYDNDEDYCEEYGGLYTLGEALKYDLTEEAQGICPAGWYVPAENDWAKLINYLGGEYVAGGKMKEAGTEHWELPNTGATNESNFTALGSGYRFINEDENAGEFRSIKKIGGFLSSSQKVWILSHDMERLYFSLIYNNTTNGFSVRCIKKVE